MAVSNAKRISRYGARKDDNMYVANNFDFRPFQFCHKIQYSYYVHVAITTINWDRLYKLLEVLLDVSICFLAMISPCKRTLLYIDWNRHLEIGP